MFTASSQLNVTLICGPTDMRKAIDELCSVSVHFTPLFHPIFSHSKLDSVFIS